MFSRIQFIIPEYIHHFPFSQGAVLTEPARRPATGRVARQRQQSEARTEQDRCYTSAQYPGEADIPENMRKALAGGVRWAGREIKFVC